MVKHVSFDIAGTLYKETKELLEARDYALYTAISKIINEPDLTIVKQRYRELYQKAGSNSAVLHSLGKPWGYWHDTLDEVDITKYIEPDADLVRILRELKEKFSLSAYSTFHKDRILKVLKKLEIPRDFFSFIVGGDEVKARKPDLEGFYKIIELAGIPGKQIIYIGDRVETDIIPAKKAGMKTCLVGGSSPEADYSVDNLNQLAEILGNNN